MAKYESEVPNEETGLLVDNLDAGNLVDQLDELKGADNVKPKTNASIYNETHKLYGAAKQSMANWKKRYTKALMLAKMQPSDSSGNDIDSKDFPFAGASVAMLPYIFEAMLDFHGRAVPDLVWSEDLVSVKINGAKVPELEIPEGAPPEQAQQIQAQYDAQVEKMEKVKEDRASRVEEYSNYQITNDVPLWRDSTDKALLALPCVGTYYKKTYFNSDLKKICSDLKMADKIVFDMACESFSEAPDKFEEVTYSRNELIGYIRGDQAWDIDEDDLEDDKHSFDFIEAHTWIDLDEDGIKEPYCAVLYPAKNKIVYLYPDYDEDLIHYSEGGALVRIEDKEVYTQTIFLPDPEGGPMGVGWGILLGPMFTAINTLLRDNIDAGTLNLTTANSGLIAMGIGKGRGNRQQAGPIDVQMGQLTPVEMGGVQGSLQQNVLQLPFSGPSSTLFELMSFLIDSARTMTTAAYNVEAQTGEAASLYLARLQQGLKTPNSIVMRVYGAQRKEFQKIGLLNFKHHDSFKYNKVLDLPTEANMKADFNPDDCDVNLVADPSKGSDIERVGKAQNVYDIALGQMERVGRSVVDIRQASIDLMEALGTDDVDRLAPEPPQGPSPEEQEAKQKEAAREAMLMEFENRKIAVDESKHELEKFKHEAEKLKQVRDSALELTKAGLQADLDESTITKNYAESLAKLVKDAGLSYGDALNQVTRIEDQFIESEGGQLNGRPIQTIKQDPSRDMA